MSNLKSKGDLTIKLLNLDLFYKGGTPVLCYKSIQIQNAIFQLIFEILKKFFQLSTSLEYFYQKRYKIERFKSLKFTYEWRHQMWRHNLTFGVIL